MNLNEYMKYQMNTDVNTFDELKSLLKTLKINEMKIGKETLNLKYKKPYEEIQNKIFICVKAIVLKEIQNIIYFKKEDVCQITDITKKISDYINSLKEIKEISDNVKTDYTLNNYFFEKILKIRDDVVALYYLDYWFSKVVYDEERKMYYSYISKMWYDGKNWVRPFDKVFDIKGKNFILEADDRCVYGLPAYKEDVSNYPEI